MKPSYDLTDDLATQMIEDSRRCLEEDVGDGDLSAALIPKNHTSWATIISREPAVICGSAWLQTVFLQLDHNIRIDWAIQDGDPVHKNQEICRLHGPSHALLTGERTALNFLQTLSATATRARQFATAVDGTGVHVLDTRKTLPGLRLAQKYAVKCGGCYNHRLGLYDAILLKENHIKAAGSITAAVQMARQLHPKIPIEVEVEDLDELICAKDANVERVLLDNFDNHQLHKAVSINSGQMELEASGGITLQNIRDIAMTGVNFISVGEITKSIRAIDLSMRFIDSNET